jgi:hypothetical protein
MSDDDVLTRIQALVDEEHTLRNASTVDTGRLDDVEEMLDQCWDLLRQRRARRDYGGNPDQASARDIATVENYEQ